jgi:hypothetical protein
MADVPGGVMEELLKRAAETGDLSRVKGFGRELWLPHRHIAVSQLAVACARNHLHVAVWLHSVFTSMQKDIRDTYYTGLCVACQGGHLSVVKWLYATFRITLRDIGKCYNDCMFGACVGGHLHVAQWLHTAFGPVRDMEIIHDALCFASLNSDLAMVQWLCTTYKLHWPCKAEETSVSYGRCACGEQHGWHLRPHAVMLAARLPCDVMTDVMRALTRA